VTEAASQAAPRTPADGTAEVWWARRGDASPRLGGLLDDVERERWNAYRREADRDRFLVGCGLAKTVIAACTGRRAAEVSFDRACRRCGRAYGKLVLRGGDLEVLLRNGFICGRGESLWPSRRLLSLLYCGNCAPRPG
jgi:hypothetical protein